MCGWGPGPPAGGARPALFLDTDEAAWDALSTRVRISHRSSHLGDEFAIAATLADDGREALEKHIEAMLRSVTRPFEIEEKMIQVGAFAGMASAPASEIRVPDLLRRADIALDHAKSGRVVRPIWFDDAMERALLMHGEIEQGIRFGLELAIAAIAAIVVVVAAPVRAEAPLPSVVQVLGTVTNAARPVANALVIALNLQDFAAEQVWTAADGSFTLPALRADARDRLERRGRRGRRR